MRRAASCRLPCASELPDCRDRAREATRRQPGWQGLPDQRGAPSRVPGSLARRAEASRTGGDVVSQVALPQPHPYPGRQRMSIDDETEAARAVPMPEGDQRLVTNSTHRVIRSRRFSNRSDRAVRPLHRASPFTASGRALAREQRSGPGSPRTWRRGPCARGRRGGRAESRAKRSVRPVTRADGPMGLIRDRPGAGPRGRRCRTGRGSWCAPVLRRSHRRKDGPLHALSACPEGAQLVVMNAAHRVSRSRRF